MMELEIEKIFCNKFKDNPSTDNKFQKQQQKNKESNPS